MNVDSKINDASDINVYPVDLDLHKLHYDKTATEIIKKRIERATQNIYTTKTLVPIPVNKNCILLISSIDWIIQQEHLIQLFSTYGELNYCHIFENDISTSAGIILVEWRNLASIEQFLADSSIALQKLNKNMSYEINKIDDSIWQIINQLNAQYGHWSLCGNLINQLFDVIIEYLDKKLPNNQLNAQRNKNKKNLPLGLQILLNNPTIDISNI